MKISLSLRLFAFFGLGLTAFADLDLTKEQAASIKSYDLQEVEVQAPKLIDQIVKVKVTRRASPAQPLPDGTFSGTVGYYTNNYYTTGKNRLGSVAALIPKEGLDWYNKLPTAFETHKTVIVFAKIVQGPTGGIRAEILGRDLKTDLKGAHISW